MEHPTFNLILQMAMQLAPFLRDNGESDLEVLTFCLPSSKIELHDSLAC